MNVMLPTVDPAQRTLAPPNSLGRPRKLTHLEQLEAESIHIIREAVAIRPATGHSQTCTSGQ